MRSAQNRRQRRVAGARIAKNLRSGNWGPWYVYTRSAIPEDVFAHFPRMVNIAAAHRNLVYVVMWFTCPTSWGTVTQLVIRRNDGAMPNSWADFQRIKNELVGEGAVAVQVHPPQHQLVDDANLAHLWVLPSGMQLPFGLHAGVPGWGFADAGEVASGRPDVLPGS